MARKHGEQATAGQRLQALRDQIGALLKRKQELGALTTQPDTENAPEWVDKAAPSLGELAAIDKALPALEAEARAAEEQLKAQHAEEMAAAAEMARTGLEPKLQAVVDALQPLDAAFRDLAQQEQLCLAYGGWLPQTGGQILAASLASFRGYLKADWPHLLGLPRKPTRWEQILAQARFDLQAAERKLAEVKGDKPDFDGWDTADVTDLAEKRRLERESEARARALPKAQDDWKRIVKAWEETVRLRRRRLAELEAAAPGGHGPRDVVRRALLDVRETGARQLAGAEVPGDSERSIYEP